VARFSRILRPTSGHTGRVRLVPSTGLFSRKRYVSETPSAWASFSAIWKNGEAFPVSTWLM
jgi:hypothetical protein